MKKILMSAAAFFALLAAPSIADAAVRGYATANVNMRSGPSTAYPAVVVVPVGASVTINGCMSSVNWCDVSFAGGRGWVSGTYVQTTYRSNRVYVEPNYYGGLGIPSVTFDVDNYWGRHYRDRDFYRDRDRWRRYDWDRADRRPPPPPRWDDDRRPPPPRWDDDRRPRPPRFDEDNRRPQRWDDNNGRPPRMDEDNRRPQRWDDNNGRPPRMDDDNRRPQRWDDDSRRPQPDRDRSNNDNRNGDDRRPQPGADNRPPRPQPQAQPQQDNNNRGDAPRRPWAGNGGQENGVVCTGPGRDCR